MQQQSGGIMDAMSNKQGNSADASLGGTAQAIDTKVKAYQNNPQALEKRLGANSQLLDLLALQKVKSKQEAANNELKLSEQQNPSTIMQQREQEVLAMTKDDMAQQTAGILGQRQKQQQKNMQRTAKGAPQGAPQQPPIMAARGGLMPLPRPNMQKMAQGGIIGYDAGGGVDPDEAKLVAAFGKDYQQVLADMSPEQRKSAVEALGIRSNIGGFFGGIADIATLPFRAAKENYQDFKESPVGQAITGGIGYKKPVPKPEDNAPLSIEQLQAAAIPKEEVIVEEEEDTTTGTGTGTGAGAGAGTLVRSKTAAEEARDAIDKPLPDTSGISSTMATDALGTTLKDKLDKQLSPNIPKEQNTARSASDKGMRRVENREELEGGIAAQREFQERQLDPEKVKKEKLMSALIGGGQRGLLGAAMGGQQADKAAQGFEGNSIKEINKLINDKVKADIDVGRIGETAANQVYASLTASSSAAANTLANVSQANVEMLAAEGEKLYQKHRDTIADKMALASEETQRRRNEILESGQNASTLTALLKLKVDQETANRELAALLPGMEDGPALTRRAAAALAKGEDPDFDDDELATFTKYTEIQDQIAKNSTETDQLTEDIMELSNSDGMSGRFGGK